jgi:hypothetical protein
MAVYFSMRIMDRALDYKAVVTKYPQFKEDIDAILVAEGEQDLIAVQ